MNGTAAYPGRVALVPAVLAHLFALAGLIGYWQQYRWPVAAAAVFAGSLLLPFGLAAVVRRSSGALPLEWAVGVAAGVLAVSVAVPALLPATARGTLGAWNWGTGAMTLLGLAVFVPTVVTLWLAGVHGLLAVGVVLSAGSGAWTAHLVLVAAVVPPLAAAQYLRSYAAALCRRAIAADQRLVAETGREQLDVVRLADVHRLGLLRERIEPLLAHVAGAGALPLDDRQADAARSLAEQLRDALAAQRQGLWLPERLGEATLIVVSAPAVVRALSDPDRVWLATLVDLLDRYPGWCRARLVLDLRTEGGVVAVLTAQGPTAAVAVHDVKVRALCTSRAVQLDCEGDLLVVDALLAVSGDA